MTRFTLTALLIFFISNAYCSNTDSSFSKLDSVSLPRLVDLGASKCVACLKLAPILEELKKEYKGQLEVVFIDVWKNNQAGYDYKINRIPTQIFYDSTGKELKRHEGFISKADILKEFEKLGIVLSPLKKE